MCVFRFASPPHGFTHRCSNWSTWSGGRASPRRRRRRSSGWFSLVSLPANRAAYQGTGHRCADKTPRFAVWGSPCRKYRKFWDPSSRLQPKPKCSDDTNKQNNQQSFAERRILKVRSLNVYTEQSSHHLLLLFSRLDEAWIGPAGAKVVVEQSGGVQSEQDLNRGTGPMWGQRSRQIKWVCQNGCQICLQLINKDIWSFISPHLKHTTFISHNASTMDGYTTCYFTPVHYGLFALLLILTTFFCCFSSESVFTDLISC